MIGGVPMELSATVHRSATDVGVRHERGGDGDGQPTGVLHLLTRVGVQVLAPLAAGAGHNEKLCVPGGNTTGKLLPAWLGEARPLMNGPAGTLAAPKYSKRSTVENTSK